MSTPNDAASVRARRPLQSLPSLPINRRMTSENVATLSIPKTPTTATRRYSNGALPIFQENDCTPPITPISPEKTALDTSSSSYRSSQWRTNSRPSIRSFADITPAPYPNQSGLAIPESMRSMQVLGSGAWSTVYRTIETSGENEWPQVSEASPSVFPADVFTPPNSPSPVRITFPSAILSKMNPPRMVAIKAPVRRDAHDILKTEARILTYLRQFPDAGQHIVGFRGYIEERHWIIMDAHPSSLEGCISDAARSPSTQISSNDPIIGRREWDELATKLVSGLAFLHSHDCVHGDIKPGNVLLTSVGLPVICDFSSSRIVSVISEDSTGADSGEGLLEISAVTTEYASPELLRAMLPSTPDKPVGSFASDVFALGVTLLVAATGQNPYVQGRGMMRLAMAREGRPMDFAAGGPQGQRVGKHVIASLRGALRKEKEKRWTDGEWGERLREVQKAVCN
ncbi:hypothetical protein MMC25_001322 [Agyrium rufum]|nr:hypothetical protein [Agyrium rufum]